VKDKVLKPVGEKLGWQLKDRRSLMKTQWNEIVSDEIVLHRKQRITYTYVISPGAVFVVPVTKEGKFVLIRNYRWTIDEVCWEVPAGLRNHSVAKTVEALCRAEMKEEAGCVGGEMHFVGEFFSANGVCDLRLFVNLALGVDLEESAPEDSESILEIKAFTRAELEMMLDKGEVSDGDSVFCLLLAFRYLDKMKA